MTAKEPRPPSTGSRDLVIWRTGDVWLAAELEAVAEIAPVGRGGKARTRDGEVDVVTPPRLEREGSRSNRAVVLRRGSGAGAARVALAADEVGGVVEAGALEAREPPAWLGRLEAAHVRALVRVDEHRVATLLDVASLFP